MSASSASQNPTTTKAVVNDEATEPQKDQQKAAAELGEDDEFEDFPVEDWAQEDTELPGGGNQHLWEESWDDDDQSEDFAAQLRYVPAMRRVSFSRDESGTGKRQKLTCRREELKKVDANKRG